MLDDLQEWKAFLEHIWDYGNKRHIAKAEYEGSLLSLVWRLSAHSSTASQYLRKAPAKSHRKSRKTSKPLLHQVLNSAGFKACRESNSKSKGMKNNAKQLGTFTEKSASNLQQPQRHPLFPADPNGQLGSSERPKYRGHDQELLLQTADEG